MKKVSILIPLHNSAAYLAQTIESALAQTWGNKEIIIIDDASTDESLKIAESFIGRGVKVFSQINSGASATRNTAFSKSTGDYIQYLDADDLLHKDKIEYQMGILNSSDDKYLASCQWGRFSQNHLETKFEKQDLNQDLNPIDWLVTAWEKGEMMQTGCWLTPRELIETSGGWNDQLPSNPIDDGEFFARIILKSKGIKYCHEARVFYRSGISDSLSQSLSSVAINSIYSTLEIYEMALLSIENSERTKHACMKNYLNFIYQFHPKHPELIAKSENRIKTLGFKYFEPVGGRFARILGSYLGFKNMLTLRSWLKKIGV